MRPEASVQVGIRDLVEVTAARVLVELKDGRKVWVPRKVVQWLPAAVVMPEWLARKLLRRSP